MNKSRKRKHSKRKGKRKLRRQRGGFLKSLNVLSELNPVIMALGRQKMMQKLINIKKDKLFKSYRAARKAGKQDYDPMIEREMAKFNKQFPRGYDYRY